MAGTSRPGSLSERLRQRRVEEERLIAAERERSEERIRSEFRRLGESVRDAGASAQRTIESAMEEVVERQIAVLQWSWVLPLGAGIGVFVLILLGNWGLTRWLSSSIRSQIEIREGLREEIREQSRTLEELEAVTWGVELREVPEGRFVVLEEGSEVDPNWRLDGRPAIRIGSD